MRHLSRPEGNENEVQPMTGTAGVNAGGFDAGGLDIGGLGAGDGDTGGSGTRGLEVGGRNTGELDTSIPALVVRMDDDMFHHGTLAVIRSLGRAGVPVHAVLEGRHSPVSRSRYLTRMHTWHGLTRLSAGRAAAGRGTAGRDIAARDTADRG